MNMHVCSMSMHDTEPRRIDSFLPSTQGCDLQNAFTTICICTSPAFLPRYDRRVIYTCIGGIYGMYVIIYIYRYHTLFECVNTYISICISYTDFTIINPNLSVQAGYFFHVAVLPAPLGRSSSGSQ